MELDPPQWPHSLDDHFAEQYHRFLHHQWVKYHGLPFPKQYFLFDSLEADVARDEEVATRLLGRDGEASLAAHLSGCDARSAP